ncbi:MAG: antibiotic biosynthesis monooxygenase [Desulfobacterales bacterium]|nr:antibiotic biosynthesis monooxygenase [Desulfobacterales bacterium]
MIHVLATIELKPGCRDVFLDKFRSVIPEVKAEEGCIAYYPAIDVDSGISVQKKVREDTVIIIEAWESPDALKRHLVAPHMSVYREAVKDIVVKTSVEILKPA